jgi:riboflavin synthase
LFTGIIVDLGTVASLGHKPSGASLTITSEVLAKDAALGDSIAINGACLTVVSRRGNTLSFDLSDETLGSTTLGQLRAGDRVNLEPALRADGKLGGHFVTGHVDAVGRIAAKTMVGDTFKITIEAPESVTDLLVDKGSIAVDGISLTVVEVRKGAVGMVIIPHTAAITTLGFKNAGDRVNLEADIIGKYVARFLNKDQKESKKSDATLLRSLKEAGYIQEE